MINPGAKGPPKYFYNTVVKATYDYKKHAFD